MYCSKRYYADVRTQEVEGIGSEIWDTYIGRTRLLCGQQRHHPSHFAIPAFGVVKIQYKDDTPYIADGATNNG